MLRGGTIINYCTSFRTPDDVRAEWAAAGVPWFTSDEYTRSLDAVCSRLSVNLDHNRVSLREEILERGLRALGWHAAAMPRNVIGCDQGKVCGYCGYGCSIGAKQTTTKTWLADAQPRVRDSLLKRVHNEFESKPAPQKVWKPNRAAVIVFPFAARRW